MGKIIAPKEPVGESPPEAIAWLDADKNYALGIEAGKLACRNPAGKKLASVPKELKESALAEQLTALCEWLADHRTDCLRRIEMWMLRSLLRELTLPPAWLSGSRRLCVQQGMGEREADRGALLDWR